MDIRKLVKSGQSSHTVSLPKDWIEKNKLEKGERLYLREDNNKIVISLKEKKPKKTKKEITIEVDNKEVNSLRRKTISAYINNYHIFRFHGKTLNKKLEDIRKILDNFLALEIVEQSATKLVAKDFLDLEEFSIDKTIRRMDMLTRSMIKDAKKGKAESEALYLRDFEVDKFFFLMSRLIRSNLSNPSSDIPNVKLLLTWWFAKNLESVADSAKKISKYYDENIKDVYNELEQFYLDCIKSYVKKDKELADEMIEKRLKLLDRLDKFEGDKKHLLKAFVKHSRNLAKVVLDSSE